MITSTVVEVPGALDQLGEREVFSNDLYPLVPSELTLHLDEDGLPKRGTVIRPGMVLVGKIGKTARYDAERQPTDLEMHGWSPEAVKAKYGHMWYDASRYADVDSSGIVEDAFLRSDNGREVAVVVLSPTP